MPTPSYKRLLLKLSGEALMGRQAFGIDVAVMDRLAGDIGPWSQAGVELGVVVGGGNIYRGVQGAAQHGMDRATSDYMGMLATVMNALALQSALEKQRLRSARAVGHPDADGVRGLRAAEGAASPAEQARRDFRRRHRQSVLHHRHDGGAAGRRDELRRHPEGDPGRRHLLRRPQEGSRRPSATRR